MKAVHVGKTERKIIDLPIPSPEADEVLIKGEFAGRQRRGRGSRGPYVAIRAVQAGLGPALER